jgi:hypothetical protein
MAETIEHYKSVAEKEYNQRGSTYSSSVSGDVFQVGEQRYVLDMSSHYPAVFNCDTGESVKDTAIISSVVIQMETDKQTAYARNKVAKILSDKDPVLAEILRWHLEYTGGKVREPVKRDGIDFYSVGHNASHSFYAGAKNGKAYKMSAFYDYDPETGKDLSEEHICEVAGDWGYMGHY